MQFIILCASSVMNGVYDSKLYQIQVRQVPSYYKILFYILQFRYQFNFESITINLKVS